MAQQETTQQTVPEEIIFDDLETMKQYTGMGRTAVYAAIRDHDFPQPYQFGKRIVRWKRVEVLEWMESRKRGTRLTPVQRKQQQEVAA
jgi:predicted DNA-binding transcriptional regulator AlpA